VRCDAEREVEQLRDTIRRYEERDENCQIGATFGAVAGGLMGAGIGMGAPRILGIRALGPGFMTGVGAAAGAFAGCHVGRFLNVRTWGATLPPTTEEPLSPPRTPNALPPQQQQR
jgi:uncharacterized protein YcfJ